VAAKRLEQFGQVNAHMHLVNGLDVYTADRRAEIFVQPEKPRA
jgi:hypothetical protein